MEILLGPASKNAAFSVMETDRLRESSLALTGRRSGIEPLASLAPTGRRRSR
ncbi:MAG TPA: hypothetical protein VNO30_24340 [Kofleriaceae bacterium]|nr:hypothetical protein [Kofleriaceae bacterium]